MSSIKKISIQGIRSFSPHDENRPELKFFSPLTLILGPNGTGKTTIIECLKYITTGDMPPNASKGGCFTYDPKLAHETEVRGQIKLQLQDVLGKKVTVTRSLLATQKPKRIEQKTLDGTIYRETDDGTPVTLTSKCADLNKEMIACLGVSKPILNNVIFCHQEESTWPLSEGKQLKQKFDEIFAAARYIKALETMRKMRLDLNVEKQVYTEQVKSLCQNKEQADKIKKTLEENETRLLVSTDSVKKVKEKLKPLEDRLDDIAVKEQEISKVYTQIVKKQTQLKEMEKNIQELKSKITTIFPGSMEELTETITEFEVKFNDKQRFLQKLGNEIKQKQRDCEQHNSNKSAKLLQIGKLKTEAEHHKKKLEKRDKQIQVLSHQYEIEDFETLTTKEFSSAQVDNFLKIMNGKLTDVTEESKKEKFDYESKEKDFQNKIDELRDSKTKLEQSIKMKNDQMNKNIFEQKQVEQELRRIDASAAKQDQIEDELKRAEGELEIAENSLNINEIRNEIEQMKQTRTEKEMKLKKLDKELSRMHLQSSTTAELELHRNDKITKTDSIRKMLRKHEESLNHVLGEIPTENIRYEVENATQKLTDDIKTMTDKFQKICIKKSSAESKKNLLKDQLKKREEELKGFEEKIFRTCGSQNFDSGLENLQKSVKELQDEKGALVGTRFVYTKFIEKLQKKDPCCPLCRREFDDDQDVTELIHDLNSKLRLIPNQMESKTKMLNEQEEKFNTLLQLKPLKEQMKNLDDEIPKLKMDIKNLTEQIEQNNAESTKIEENLETKRIDLIMAQSVQSDMVAVDQMQSELKKIERKIASLSSKLIGGDTNRTIHQVTDEKESLQREIDALKQDLERKQERMTDHMELIQQLKGRVNDLRTEQLNISAQLQRFEQLEGKKSDLMSNSDECRRLIQQSKEQLSPLENQLQQTKDEKEAITVEKEHALNELKNKAEEIQNNFRDIVFFQNDIKKYINDGGANKLNECEEELKRMETNIQRLEEERLKLNQDKDQIQKDLSNQQIRRRELEDNLQFRQKEKEVEIVKTQIEELEKDYGDFDIVTLRREKLRLQNEVEQLKVEKSQAEGRQRELDTIIRNLKIQLKDEMFDRAHEKHKEKLIQLRTTDFAINDLKKYYDALDSAIMKYHMVKMEEINKIIRELWQNTYKGNDIDYIEIRTDQDESAAGGLDKRRVYHYRVVMIKSDTAMDMRGRCSAGQKVLASLIIRLALAETFCINCGIFTLDEPTTNLDRDNIVSLAEALTQIVNSRQRQRNFQLVIITHDEEFIDLLGRSEYVDYYYRIGKDHRGFSQITKCSIKSLT